MIRDLLYKHEYDCVNAQINASFYCNVMAIADAEIRVVALFTGAVLRGRASDPAVANG